MENGWNCGAWHAATLFGILARLEFRTPQSSSEDTKTAGKKDLVDQVVLVKIEPWSRDLFKHGTCQNWCRDSLRVMDVDHCWFSYFP